MTLASIIAMLEERYGKCSAEIATELKARYSTSLVELREMERHLGGFPGSWSIGHAIWKIRVEFIILHIEQKMRREYVKTLEQKRNELVSEYRKITGGTIH